ncbi:integration host factor subunit alpha [Candidatus Vesicomyidisocius calyptogenae]|uniref:Integration host factor subunit alpha n=1 Tax=Vesicomyosocius okutanii subsp. Calyptogena okutanii (strain HA) TaxID=412965 RepID=A5CWF3_VESOH|nr:integration host factor subunit alpha [Candidatus Vesicomyosocius okutanii]BAF61704.1 integration host factor, alpha subunit [Candidatus Vesicomyosocius okutanii]
MSITKKDIANVLVKSMDITHVQALSITHDFFDQIKQTLASGESVKLSSFGNFIIREKSSRVGRNPKTGEMVEISARRVVVFKSGPKLKLATQKDGYFPNYNLKNFVVNL